MEFVFSNHKNGIVSYLIRYLTEAPVSHVSLRFDGDESNWMAEAVAGGVKPGWWNYWMKKNTVYARYKLVGFDEALLEKLVDETLDETIGTRYDIMGVIGFAIAIIVKRVTGKTIKNIFGSSKLCFCSEFIMKLSKRIYSITGNEIYTGDPELTSPGDELKQSENNRYLSKIQ